MASASTLETMSPQLLRGVERAQREPEGRFHSLAHLIDVPALERAYHRSRKDAAVGVVRVGLRPPRKRQLRHRENRAAQGESASRDRAAYCSEGWIRFFQSAGLRRPCQTAKTTIWSSSTQ